MLKVRVIPILTFNGISLVKTKQFSSPRIVGNPVQAARVYNSRGVDELVFLDIFATKQKRKINLSVVRDVIKECFMPVVIGGGIRTIADINDLLRIGADKIVIKSEVIKNIDFVKHSSNYFGSQCISVSVDVYKDGKDYLVLNDLGKLIPADFFVNQLQELGAGEIILNSVERDGMMNGFDIEMIKFIERRCSVPIVCVGGGGNLQHYEDLFRETNCQAVGSASIFHFTQYTPLDIKKTIGDLGKPIRSV
jgi:cyclase